jgi:hypothetical protein
MAHAKGDIVWVSVENRDKTKLKHPAVVWEYTNDDSNFVGIMLTHTGPNERFNNILMNEEHFIGEHEVKFSNTHFVNQLFNKFQSWGPFHKAGRLSGEGITFIHEQLNQDPPLNFDDYIRL